MLQMVRENARLLFLYALRSNAACEEALRPQDFYLRLARKTDIAAIRDCNIRTLPENYTPQASAAGKCVLQLVYVVLDGPFQAGLSLGFSPAIEASTPIRTECFGVFWRQSCVHGHSYPRGYHRNLASSSVLLRWSTTQANVERHELADWVPGLRDLSLRIQPTFLKELSCTIVEQRVIHPSPDVSLEASPFPPSFFRLDWSSGSMLLTAVKRKTKRREPLVLWE